MKFADIRQGDTLLTLEQDRRSQFPIFDTAKVQRVGQSSYQRTGTSQSVIQVVQLTLADSTGTFDVTVPLEAEDTIFDKV